MHRFEMPAPELAFQPLPVNCCNFYPIPSQLPGRCFEDCGVTANSLGFPSDFRAVKITIILIVVKYNYANENFKYQRMLSCAEAGGRKVGKFPIADVFCPVMSVGDLQ